MDNFILPFTDFQTDLAVHCLQVYNLRGAWTPSNRDVALDMYDAYVKSQRTKKNLSSEALHGFKVDSMQSAQVRWVRVKDVTLINNLTYFPMFWC